MNNETNLLYIDLFCGAGGVTEGISRNPQAKVIACVNHDENAIKSHKANHPDSHHFIEDIRTLDLTELTAITAKARKDHPGAKVVLWASLECTHFSSAKGGQKRDPDSRTLAEHLLRYIDKLDPDYVQIENVREFMTWGKLLDNGKPDPADKGKAYSLWVYNIKKRGYNYDFKLINSADLGAYTARLRYFGTFAKKNLPIVWPKMDQVGKPVRDVLDLTDIGEDIFKRAKPLVDKTLERLYHGLKKMANDQGVMSYYGRNDAWSDINKPNPTVTTNNRFALITAKAQSVMTYYGNGNVTGIDKPAPTITTKDRLALITSKPSHMVMTYYSPGNCHNLLKPSPTLTTTAQLALVTVKPNSNMLMTHYSNGTCCAIDKPSPTITTVPKVSLVTTRLMSHWLINPQYQSKGRSIDRPCFTLIARMDKAPPYLMSAVHGQAPSVTGTDWEQKLKLLMHELNIESVHLRMFKIPELKRIMGFDTDYKLIGTQTEQKKFIGNAVEVNTAAAISIALSKAINNHGLVNEGKNYG